jgi:glutamine synthetase
MIALNTIVANQLIEFKNEVDALLEKGLDKDEAILKVLRNYIVSSKKIIFEGNGYSDEWVTDAAQRGLENLKNTPEALNAYVSEKNIKLFSKYNILSEREMHARYHIELEKYFKKIQIESRILGDLALNHIIPTAIKYQNLLIENVMGIRSVFRPDEAEKHCRLQVDSIAEISGHINFIKEKVHQMTDARKLANKIEDASVHAADYCNKVRPYFDEIRYHIDKLELLIDDELWTLPKYRELFFIR